jgi:hypothetical protein
MPTLSGAALVLYSLTVQSHLSRLARLFILVHFDQVTADSFTGVRLLPWVTGQRCLPPLALPSPLDQ